MQRPQKLGTFVLLLCLFVCFVLGVVVIVLFSLLPLSIAGAKRSVFTIYQVNLTQSTTLEQKRLDLRSLSPALPNLW